MRSQVHCSLISTFTASVLLMLGGCVFAEEPRSQQELNLFFSPKNMAGESVFSISLRRDIIIKSKAEMTEKGNGTLQLGNLLLRIYDRHDDGLVYENGLLKLDFIDLDGDSIDEAIVSGVLKSTGEDAGDPVSFSSVNHIFSLNCDTGLFEQLYSSSAYEVVLQNDQSKTTRCK